MDSFDKLGVIKNDSEFDELKLNTFTSQIESLKNKGTWTKKEIVNLFFEMLPEFEYEDKGKFLDSKM